MKRKLLLLGKVGAVVTAFLLAFGYGVAVSEYEVFPFQLLKFVQKSNARFLGDADEGKRLFATLCAQCHGIDGSGAEGPSLVRQRLSRASDDEGLRQIIVNGIDNGQMPPVRQTTLKEQNDLIAYVRALGRSAAPAARGNVARGKELYGRLKCASCHIINGEGTAVGPELTRIASSRGPDYVRQALVDPEAALPTGTSDTSHGLPEFLPVRAVARDGTEIRGLRINEDTFTIQVRDSENRFHTMEKADLKELVKERKRSVMPSYKDQVTAAQLDDLVAYLSQPLGTR
jgi:cytochrome c oxidase cbb3-type subunit III